MANAEDIKRNVSIHDYMQRRGATFKRNGGEDFCLCPLHDDHNPSMRIKGNTWYCDPCQKGGTVIDLHMMIGNLSLSDALTDLEEMAGLSDKPSTPPPPKPVKPAEKNFAAIYDYESELGELLFQVCRTEDKKFFQRRLHQNKWQWGLGDTRRVLYHLPEVLKADTVVVCEGEKDADTWRSLGYCATTCPMGSGKWLDAYSDNLTDKHIIISHDNDDPGRKHRDMIIKSLEGKVEDIAVLRIPDPHNDATDWAEEFSTLDAAKADAKELISQATLLPKGMNIPVMSIGRMQDMLVASLARDVENTVDLSRFLPSLRQSVGPLEPGEVVTLIADTGQGKSAVLQNMCMRLPEHRILFFELELPDKLLTLRYTAAHENMSILRARKLYSAGKKPTLQHVRHVWTCTRAGLTVEDIVKITRQSELLIGSPPTVVIVDYLQLIKGGGGRYERFSNNAEDLKTFAKEANAVLVQASQIKRPIDERFREPSLHDAKESGSIENSSGLILGMWLEEHDDSSMNFRVLKATSGRTGLKVSCKFDGPTLRIKERENQGVESIMSDAIEGRRAAEQAGF